MLFGPDLITCAFTCSTTQVCGRNLSVAAGGAPVGPSGSTFFFFFFFFLSSFCHNSISMVCPTSPAPPSRGMQCGTCATPVIAVCLCARTTRLVFLRLSPWVRCYIAAAAGAESLVFLSAIRLGDDHRTASTVSGQTGQEGTEWVHPR